MAGAAAALVVGAGAAVRAVADLVVSAAAEISAAAARVAAGERGVPSVEALRRNLFQ